VLAEPLRIVRQRDGESGSDIGKQLETSQPLAAVGSEL
jgi:hypothetical protein